MVSSLGKLRPFVSVSTNSGLYNTVTYPVGGTNPPPSGNPGLSVPGTVGGQSSGPIPGLNCVNLINLRQYYNLPYPPTTPLASPPVIAVVSFGGGIYGQPVSSGQYAGFWKCTDVSGVNGAPIQILVNPINGAINAPNADDGGATLENTVDVATISAFYGMLNQGNNIPTYTPPVIILYIAPSDDMSQFYNTFYTVLNSPVVCNGKSYSPSIVCCSWGAPEVAWTQLLPFPPPGVEVDNDPNPEGIVQLNEINALLATATNNGINICVASGDVSLPDTGLFDVSGNSYNDASGNFIATRTVMFPASSPYVTCVGGSSVYFPNAANLSFVNPGEYAWVRGEGGVSGAFPIPDYQSNIPSSALASAKAFLSSAQNTAALAVDALGAANVDGDNDASGVTLATQKKDLSVSQATTALANAQAALANAQLAAAANAVRLAQAKSWNVSPGWANSSAKADAASLQLQVAVNAANTALATAKANGQMAHQALVDAQDLVVKTSALEDLLLMASNAFHEENTDAMNAALLVANEAVELASTAIISDYLNTGNFSDVVVNANEYLARANAAAAAVPYNPENNVPQSLIYQYTSTEGYPAYDEINNFANYSTTVAADVADFDSSGSITTQVNSDINGLGTNLLLVGVTAATTAGRFAIETNDAAEAFASALAAWNVANANATVANANVAALNSQTNPSATADDIATAVATALEMKSELTAATTVLADAESVALNQANNLVSRISTLNTAVGAVGTASFTAGANRTAYGVAVTDASGCVAPGAQLSLDLVSATVLNAVNVAKVAKNDADEAVAAYNKWAADASAAAVALAAVSTAPTASLKAHAVIVANNATTKCVESAAATLAVTLRTQASTAALVKYMNNTAINTAITSVGTSSYFGTTTFVDVDGSENYPDAYNNANDTVGFLYSVFSNASPDALISGVEYGEGLVTAQLSARMAALAVSTTTAYTTALAAVDLFFGFSAPNSIVTNPASVPGVALATGYMEALASDANLALSNVTLAEGAMLYAAPLAIVPVAPETLASGAATASEVAINQKIHRSLVDASVKSKKSADNAKYLANLASARITEGAPNVSVQTIHTSVAAAALAQQAALKDAEAYVALVRQFSTVYPSLVDAATAAVSAALTATENAKLATAATDPVPVAAKTLELLQSKVLIALGAAQDSDQNNTTPGRKETLTKWNTAAANGAKSLAALTTQVGTALTSVINTYISNILTARNATLLYENPSSVAYMTAIDAYNLSLYVDISSSGTQINFLENIANSAIVAAWNAAQAANATESNAARVKAENDWNATANLMAQAMPLNGGAYDDALTDLSGAIHTAYTQTTTVSDAVNTSLPYTTAVAALNAFNVLYNYVNTDYSTGLLEYATDAVESKAASQAAITLAVSSAGQAAAAANKSVADTTALATATGSLEDSAANLAAEAAFAAADNVNMYRCIPDVAMHSDVDDLPIIFRLNGGNVYVGGTSVAAAMFAGFLGVVQANNPITYFVNPVLYNNYTYPSPLFYDLSGALDTWYAGSPSGSVIPNEIIAIVRENLSGSYNTFVGLGSPRGANLSAFLEVPELVTAITPSVGMVTVYAGGLPVTVSVTVTPSTAYNKNVTWSSSSPYNAIVSDTVSTSKNLSGNTVITATVTGLVPLNPLSPLPVITVASTDGSNVFATIDVKVLPPIQVKGVSISSVGEVTNPSNTVLYLGTTLQLIATVSPADATNKTVYWWSSNTSIVNVDVNGLITSLAPGQVTIKATTVNNNIFASISVYVPTPMTGISVQPQMVTLNPNLLVFPLKNTATLVATVTPANVDYKALTWTISSFQPLHLPPGTTDQNGNALFYPGNNTSTTPVITMPVNGNVLSTDSNGNILNNTQDTVTAVTNGTATVTVSTDGVPNTVYGVYSANAIVNVVTPITNVTLTETNMVITLSPQTAVTAVNPSTPYPNAVFADRNLAEEYSVTATLFPAWPSNMNLVWSSSNPKVAIVSNNTPPVLNITGSDPNNGLFQITELITALSNGTTTIKVTTADGAKTATVNVTVTTPVTGDRKTHV